MMSTTPDRRRQPLDGLGVADGQVGTAHQILEFGAAADADDAQLAQINGVGPELADAVAQRLVEAADERRHADDRRDADDDAEHVSPERILLVRRVSSAMRTTSPEADELPIHV